MRNITVTVGPLAAASANNIAQSQTPAAGNLILNGSSVSNGVATLDNARRVLITAAGNESANTFTIVGTNVSGNPISETLVGPNASTAQSVLDYKTVSCVSITNAASGAVQVGTSGVASSPWVALDGYALPQVAVQCNATGAVNYTVQSTLDNPNSLGFAGQTPIASVNWVNTSDTGAVNATGTIQTNFAYAPQFARILLNSGTGTVKAHFLQLGAVPF